MRRLRWLWADRIPVGIIAMLAGRGGEGKSTFALWLAAQLTRGTLPGEYLGTPQNVLYVAFEDDAGAVVKPRAIAAGVDTAYLHMLTIRQQGSTLESSPSLVTDLALIEQQVRALEAAAVIVDPLSSGMHGVNRDRSSDVRPVLDGIAELAARTGAAVLAVAHTSKGGGDVRDKISGSHEYVDRSRAVLMFATDDDGTKVMQQTKGNYSRGTQENIAFRLDSAPVVIDGHTVEVGTVTIIGETSRTVGDIINADGENVTGNLSDAQRWLLELMSDYPDQSALTKTVMDAARRDGFSQVQIDNARTKYNRKPPEARGYRSIQSGRSGSGWAWTLSDDGD